jgi:hypothetical protein
VWQGWEATKELTLTIATMVHNAFSGMQDILASLLTTTTGPYHFIFLDDASEKPMKQFLFDDLKSYWEGRCIGEPKYIRSDENVGIPVGSQLIVDNCTTDLLAIFHNDVQILQPDWDTEVLKLFASDPKLGLVSFFGCPGVMANGSRGGMHPGIGTGWSNMIDAEQHGARISEPRAIAVPDGFAMILRRKMLKVTGGYGPHNYHYDIALGLQSLAAGFHNMVAPISCRHLGTQTRLKPDYMKWMGETFGTGDQWAVYKMWDADIVKIWGPCLPLYVYEDFSFAKIDPLTGVPTGQNIREYDWKTAPE